MESLEAREVPAFCAWTGAVSTSFDDPANWLGGVPQAGDDVMFSTGPGGGEGLTSGSVDCSGMQAASGGAYNSVILDSTYTGRVTLSGGFTTDSFTLAGGTIDQPSSGTDITVTDSFSWTGGTLNSTDHLATLTLDGADASFAPAGGGTVELGSDITLANGAEGTMEEGTIDVNKDGIQFITTTGSHFRVDPGALKEAVLGFASPQFLVLGFIQPGTSWTVDTGTFKFGGPIGNGGTVTLMPEVALSVAGKPDTNEGYVQWGGAATYLHGDSVLASLNEPVLIQGGTFATVWAPSVGSANATIVSPTVKVSGGDIYAGQQQGLHVNFGVLFVDGNVEWSGGTFHPHVYADGQTRDVWMTVTDHYAGTFTITGGTIAPIYLDSDYGTSSFPTSGAKWQVLMAQGGFTNNTAPSVDDDPLWMMQIDPMNPPKYWELVAN